VMYCLSPGVHPATGGYVFTSSVSTYDLFKATLRYYRLKGWKRIAVLTSTDASGQDAERGITEEFSIPENKELELVATARFNPTDVSADAQIQRMKAANPQAIITWTSGTPLGTVFRAIAGAGWDVPVAISNSNMLYEQMSQYAGFTPKQLYIASADWLPSADKSDTPPAVQAAQKQMFDAFQAAGKKPDNAAVLAWDATMIAVTSLGKVAPDATAAQLRDYLLNLKGYEGTTGVYDMAAIPQRGVGIASTMMTRWDADAGTWKVVSHPTGTPF
jgi:branched-chain amino acid transport system substrate-binding protein